MKIGDTVLYDSGGRRSITTITRETKTQLVIELTDQYSATGVSEHKFRKDNGEQVGKDVWSRYSSSIRAISKEEASLLRQEFALLKRKREIVFQVTKLNIMDICDEDLDKWEELINPLKVVLK